MNEHILLHVCCGPCAIVPILRLREKGHTVTALFVNPNIHPLSEYLRRREALVECAQKLECNVLYRDDVWNIQQWLSEVAGTQDMGSVRCGYCYESRLNITAKMAKEFSGTLVGQSGTHVFTAFSSSLLYSRYQDHEQIVRTAENAATKFAVPFYYEDFRDEWQKGINLSKEFNLYRQAYCGCIYSEAERYEKKLQKLFLNS